MGSLSTYLCAVLSASCVLAGPALADDTNPLVALVDAATQRLQVADPVAAAKWHSGAAIEDPQRVHHQLDALSTAATGDHVDPDYVTRIFTDQIAATEAVEHYRFAQWKLDPSAAPAVAADLSASRAQIDALNHVMLTEIGLQWAALHAPQCAGELDEATRAVSDARQLDEFYRQALSAATQSYCG